MDWTEKYRPRTLADLVGNGPSVKKLHEWAQAWTKGIPKVRAVILAGPPGTGKTSAALALAADMEWQPIELNASDARNAEKIKRVATAGALHQTFGDDGSFHAHTDPEAGRKLIILDEADNLYERAGKDSGGTGNSFSDAGGKTQIIATIRQTKQPIVLIVNDLYALQKGSGAALRSIAETLKWTKVNVRSIPKALERIVHEEGIHVDRPVLEAIASNAGGDLRAAVHDLQSLCTGRDKVTLQHLESAGYRDTTGNMFDAVRHILKGRNLRELRREIRNVDATPEDLVLWVDENLPKEYTHPEDLVAGYDMLSRADRFLGRTRRSQNYRLWAYASDLAGAGVMAVKQHPGPRKFTPFGFPQYLSKMSRSRGARGLKDSLADVLGDHTHQSKRKARLHQVEVFQQLFASDPQFAATQTWRLELTDDQVALLLRTKRDTKAVATIRAAAEALEAEAGPVEAATPSGFSAFEGPATEKAEAPKDEPPKPKPEKQEGQSTLF